MQHITMIGVDLAKEVLGAAFNSTRLCRSRSTMGRKIGTIVLFSDAAKAER